MTEVKCIVTTRDGEDYCGEGRECKFRDKNNICTAEKIELQTDSEYGEQECLAWE